MGAKKSEFRELITAMFREQHKHPHLTVSLLRQHWADILGPELADKTYPARITGHSLWINALDASWAYQLQFMKHEMLESVQVFMGAVDITELRFKQGELHSAPAQAADQAVETSPADTDEVQAVETSPAAADGELRDGGGSAPSQGAAPGGMRTRDAASVDSDSIDAADNTSQATTAAIADDSLRSSFRRWAQIKKRKSRSRA